MGQTVHPEPEDNAVDPDPEISAVDPASEVGTALPAPEGDTKEEGVPEGDRKEEGAPLFSEPSRNTIITIDSEQSADEHISRLLFASSRGDVDGVKLLIKKGANASGKFFESI